MYAESTGSAEDTEADRVANAIRALYNDGVRFFTKSSIQNMMRQVDEIRSLLENDQTTEGAGTFLLEGVDGRPVKDKLDFELVKSGPALGLGASRYEVFNIFMRGTGAVTPSLHDASFDNISPGSGTKSLHRDDIYEG